MAEAGAPGAPPASARDRGTVAAVCAALALAVAALYAPVLGHEYVYCDDDRYVFENPVVKQGLTGAGAVWAFTSVHVANWHPLTWLSHMLDVELFGVDAAAHHAVNVALHAGNAVLLFLALRALTAALWPAALVAALFALHPLRVESVAWVAERKDLLSGGFFGLTLWAYAAYARQPGLLRHVRVMLCLALGLLAKPMLVTVPCLLLLLDVWPLRRWSPRIRGEGDRAPPLRGLLLEKLPLFALAAASSAAAIWSQRAGGALGDLQTLPFTARLSNAVVSYAAYLGKTLWPAGLAVFYPHPAMVDPEGYSPWNATAVVSALVLAAITALALRSWRRRPYFAVGWLWYLGMLVPVIGLVQVGDQAMADRYAYLPLVGPYVAVAWGLRDLTRARSALREPVAVAAVAVLLACASVGARQSQHWRDSGALFAHAIAVTSDNYFAHNHLGRHFENRGELARAAAEYERAVRIQPRYKGAHSNLGNTLAKRGELDRAVVHLEQAVRLDPGFAEAYSNLGVAEGMRGQPERAIAAYERALALDPGLFAAHRNLGAALLRQGEVARAVAHLERAAALDPGHADAANDLGVAYAAYGDVERAAASYRRCLALDPEHPKALCNLGLILEKRGDPAFEDAYARALERGSGCAAAHRHRARRALVSGDLDAAAEHLDALLRLRPEDAAAHNDAGVLYARRREPARARAHFEEALRLDPANEPARRNLAQLSREAGAGR